MTERAWKELPDIDIVYHGDPDCCITVDGVKYAKAYVVNHGDKKAMESATSWGTAYPMDGEKPPRVVTVKNEGFSIRVAKAADSSFRSGKLSFWMCVFERDDIEPFATSINSELLCLLITQSTLVNGSLPDGDKAFFARCNGQLGVLHEHMPAYWEYRESLRKREAVSKCKTTKWRVGNAYSSMTRCDVMLGEMVVPLWMVHNPDRNRIVWDEPYLFELDFDAAPKKIFAPYGDEPENPYVHAGAARLGRGDSPDTLNDFEACLAMGIDRPQDKCPSRHCEGQVLELDGYDKRLTEALCKIVRLAHADLERRRSSDMFGVIGEWVEQEAFALMLCSLDPKRGLDALARLEDTMRLRSGKERTGWPQYRLTHNGITKWFDKQSDLVLHVAGIAKEHYGRQA